MSILVWEPHILCMRLSLVRWKIRLCPFQSRVVVIVCLTLGFLNSLDFCLFSGSNMAVFIYLIGRLLVDESLAPKCDAVASRGGHTGSCLHLSKRGWCSEFSPKSVANTGTV